MRLITSLLTATALRNTRITWLLRPFHRPSRQLCCMPNSPGLSLTSLHDAARKGDALSLQRLIAAVDPSAAEKVAAVRLERYRHKSVSSTGSAAAAAVGKNPAEKVVVRVRYESLVGCSRGNLLCISFMVCRIAYFSECTRHDSQRANRPTESVQQFTFRRALKVSLTALAKKKTHACSCVVPFLVCDPRLID